jgi:hypothetical protein
MNAEAGPAPRAAADRIAAITALRLAMVRLWRFGSNAVVAWTPSRTGIEMLTVPMIRLFDVGQRHRRVFIGERLMGQRTFLEIAATVGSQPIEIRLPVAVGEGDGQVSTAAIEEAIVPFVVTRTDQRAVFLLDIVGFSKLLPEQQASQLTTMEFALNLAAEVVSRRGDKVLLLQRSTTGDGFYVWNAVKGVDADLNLFITMVVFLSFIGSLARSAPAGSVPVVRTCFGIGSHYTYRQPTPGGDLANEFIVGDVTISLARLMGAARANQIMVGEFTRRTEDNAELDAAAFLEIVATRLSWMRGFNLQGATIDHISLYLTGPRGQDGAFRAQRLRTVDKHGIAHHCYNVKLNIFPQDGEPFFCGLQHQALG